MKLTTSWQEECEVISSTCPCDISEQQPQQSQKQRSVRFASEPPVVHEHVHLKDMTKDETASTWYGQSELMLIKRSLIVALKMHRLGRLDEDEDTLRGLESRTREGAQTKKEVKCRSLYAVFQEELRQRELGIHDPTLIARVYQVEALTSIDSAYNRGLADAAEARLVAREPWTGKDALCHKLHSSRVSLEDLLDSISTPTISPVAVPAA